MFKYFVPVIVVLSLLPASAASADFSNALKGKEIKALISGNTAEGQRYKEGKGILSGIQQDVMFRTYFSPDNSLVEKSDGGAQSVGHVAAHGKWQLKKKALCITWSDALTDSGRMKCFKVIPKGDGAYGLYTKQGQLNRTWNRVRSGNPHNLE